MRLLTLLSALLSLALVGCDSLNSGFSIEGGDAIKYTPPEEQGATYVDVDGWRLEGGALNVTRDQSKNQVLRAAVQGGAILTSTDVPLHSQVPTVCRAQSIYYDAFHNRFELVGDPIIEQGVRVTSKYGSDARLLIYTDGKIIKQKVETLVPGA